MSAIVRRTEECEACRQVSSFKSASQTSPQGLGAKSSKTKRMPARTSEHGAFEIDVSFDFRSDTPRGKDPDTYSPSLRLHHRILWSKPLPDGRLFRLEEAGLYLRYRGERSGNPGLMLSSDTVIPTFRRRPAVQALVPEDQLAAFNAKGYTIGGMMIFPAEQVERKWTINQARGCVRKISDRFDLTVECIRRHYANETSPLSAVLSRYEGFFALFGDFRGYVEFFLLQDIVSADCSSVTMFHPCDDFRRAPIPRTVDEYSRYRQAAEGFIDARNDRIRRYARSLL